ncbi:MAG: immunoglobulin domain-containing protein, partial [Limisphaerales bacterium]
LAQTGAVCSSAAAGTQPNDASEWGQTAFAAFQSWTSWTTRYLAEADTDAKTQLLPEGLVLARERHAALIRLIETNPQTALASTVPAAVRQQLPVEILNELETRVDGIGDFIVLAADSIKGGPAVEPVQRFVRLDGRTYRAHVYGRRISQTTKNGIPLHGIVLDGVLALHASALRPLDPDEAPDATKPTVDLSKADKQSAAASTSTLAEMGGKIYRFGSSEQLREAEARLEAAEAGIGPEPRQSALAVLRARVLSRARGEASGAAAVANPWTEGNKNILIIRVDFPDLAGDPKARDGTVYTTAYVQNLAEMQIRPYFEESSYGHTSLSNIVTTQLYRVPQTSAYYATNNASDQLHLDAETAVSTNYNVGSYDRVMVLFSPLDGISGSEFQYGGLANVGAARIWLNGEFDFRSVAHELGHTYGLYHANLWQVSDGNPVSPAGTNVDAGDIFDTMGANYADDNRTDFNPWFKNVLGWISGSQVPTASTSGVYRINRFDNSTGTGTLALKIAKDSTQTYWIGIRRKFTTNLSMQHGAYIIWGHGLYQESQLLDMTTPGIDAHDAALAIDATFTDPAVGLSITPVAEGGLAPNEYLDVAITLPPLITQQPTNQTVTPGESATFSVATIGSPAPAYQWERKVNGGASWNDLTDDGTYSGTTTAMLTVTNTAKAMSGDQFRCLVSNIHGSVTSAPPAVLTVEVAPPTILMEPGTQAVAPGQDAVFTIMAIGAPLPTYQWLRQPAGSTVWTNLADDLTYQGSGTSQLTVSKTTTAMSGDQFRCLVSNASGSISSAPPSLLSVNARMVISTLAGLAGAFGTTDGTGTNARFASPFGIAAGGGGNVYVADTYNHTIRKITPAGAVSTLAGLAGNPGSADGAGTSARFNTPFGLAVDSAGNIYVADTGNDAVRKITPAAVVSTLAGLAGSPGSTDGVGSTAQFNAPFGMAVDSSGNVYVADQGNNIIRKITPAGVVTTLAGSAGSAGYADGTGSRARFWAPFGVAVDIAGNVYVADTGNNTIRRITPAGVVSTVAGQFGSVGSADGLGGNARFNGPFGIAADNSSIGPSTDASGDLYVADTYNHTLRKITATGVVSTPAGLAGTAGNSDGAGSNAQFYNPSQVAVDAAGDVYVVDSGNNTIRIGRLVVLAPPLLEITNLNDRVVLSWPALATGFVLESAASLNPVVVWNPLTNAARVTNNLFVLTNSINRPALFYRLRQP